MLLMKNVLEINIFNMRLEEIIMSSVFIIDVVITVLSRNYLKISCIELTGKYRSLWE